MNLTHVTMANLARLEPAARRARLEDLAQHNLAALERQIAWVAGRPATLHRKNVAPARRPWR
jgi:UV DNA damage repair endonuclease